MRFYVIVLSKENNCGFIARDGARGQMAIFASRDHAETARRKFSDEGISFARVDVVNVTFPTPKPKPARRKSG